MTKAEVMEIINNPTKHIQILNRNGKASIVYSAKFVELLEAIPEMFTKAIPLSVIDDIKTEIDRSYWSGMGLPKIHDIIDEKVKEYTE